MNLRTLVGALVSRSMFGGRDGRTFGGKRDLYRAFGYKRELGPEDYRARFKRNGVANRVVKALPKATWRGGGEIIEDQDPTAFTEFEEAFDLMNDRLKIWATLQRADILAGIGQYAIVVIGAPGRMDSPLLKVKGPEDIKYLMPYAQEEASVFEFDTNPESPRFGYPEFYTITRTIQTFGSSTNQVTIGKKVHWTRVLHVADGLLDDNIFGEPRLEPIWNYLDDLDKVTGGGAESFYRRADQGLQIDLDPTVDFEETDKATGAPSAAKKGLRRQIEEYEHGFRRTLLTRGAEVTPLGSDVADFSQPVTALISLISSSTGIPQRVLMGSEQGKLAAQQDRSNWDERVADRRDDFAAPYLVRPLIDRFIKIGALPTPKEKYEVRWPQLKVLDDAQRAVVAVQWASLNSAAGERIVMPDEIRDRILNLPKLDEVNAALEIMPDAEPKQVGNVVGVPDSKRPTRTARKFYRKWLVLTPAQQDQYRPKLRALASKRLGKEAPAWEHVHQAADRFRAQAKTTRSRRVQGGA